MQLLSVSENEKPIEGSTIEICGRGTTKTAELLKVMKTVELQHCFEQWKARMQRCIDRGWQYVKGDYRQ